MEVDWNRGGYNLLSGIRHVSLCFGYILYNILMGDNLFSRHSLNLLEHFLDVNLFEELLVFRAF
jgi:hypothetical protein